jgi:hypothetical protein
MWFGRILCAATQFRSEFYMSYFSLPQFFPGYSPLPDADISLEPFSNFDANQRDTTEQLRNTHSVRGGGLNLDSVASRLRMGVWDRIRGRQKACGIDEENGLSDVWPITPKPPEDILANTYDYYKAARNMGVVLRKSAFWGAALSIGYAGTNYILSQYPDNTFANGFLYVGLPALSIKPTYELLEGTYKALGKNARIFAIEALVQNHKKDKAYFAHLEKTISVPKYIKTAVDIAHKLIDEDLARFEKAKPEEILPEQLELTGRRRDWTNNFIIGRPMELKAVEKWKTEVGRAELDEEIDGALEHMHDADKEFIKTMADLVCLSSVEYVRCKSDVFDSQSLEQRMTLKNTELYRATGSNFILVGPPGVGKTYSVKQVLGKNLGAYIVGISIGIDEEGGFSIVLPKEWDVLRQTGFVPKPADVLGKAIEAQMEGQCQNVVLYFQ